jgi:tRNA(fMet)-specific endonuclease VapC
MYLVDSDVLINFLKGSSKEVKIIKKLQDKPFYISIISVGEIFEGLLGTKNNKKLISFKELLKYFVILNIDLPIIEKFAKLRKSLRQKGELIDNFDLLIASSCLANDLILLTNNLSHFKRISELKIYS